MDERRISRRSLLGRWLAIGGLVTAASRPAQAFRIEMIDAAAPLARLHAMGCGLPAEHEAIRRRLAAGLAAGPAASAGRDGAAGLPAETCPVCGCQVTLEAAPAPAP